MTRVLFSEAARGDRRAITAYTFERFGESQVQRLRDAFESLFESLADAPHVGRTRPDLDPPGHEFRYFVALRNFIVVYDSDQDGIRIARILHGARNLAAELEREPGE